VVQGQLGCGVRHHQFLCSFEVSWPEEVVATVDGGSKEEVSAEVLERFPPSRLTSTGFGYWDPVVGCESPDTPRKPRSGGFSVSAPNLG